MAALLAVACSGSADDPRPRSEAPRRELGRFSPAPIPSVTEPAASWLEAACELPFGELERIRRGYHPERSPEIIVVPREPNFFGGFTSTTHSGPWDYVQKIPLVFYGPGFVRPQGEIELDREVTIADVAPTLANLLDTPFPEDRPGRAITEALLPRAERNGVPKMILTVVWDGGGWNVLNAWPQTWPNLKRLMANGTSVAEAVVGSSPSVTPAVHATLGTGTFPKEHGIVDIPIRNGADVVGAYDGRTPAYLDVPTLADMYDPTTGNESKIGMLAYKSWHLGMIGHGAYSAGGDKDIAIIAERSQGQLVTNPEWYSLPTYLQDVPGFEEDVETVDASDGKRDGRWLGHDEVLQDPSKVRHTPVWALYQTRLLKELFEREGFGADDVPDMFFVNYKQIDDVGHDWNFLYEEMRDTLEFSDQVLADLVDHLDRTVGKNEWVLAFTADHGQSPDPAVVGAWPIHMGVVTEAVADNFGVSVDELFQDTRPVGFWLNPLTMSSAGITEEEISDFLIDYRLEDDIRKGLEVPKKYDARMQEPVFAAAFPSDEMGRIWHCAKSAREQE